MAAAAGPLVGDHRAPHATLVQGPVRGNTAQGTTPIDTSTEPAIAPLGRYQRARIALKRLSTRSHFWHAALTMVFMPSVWRSGIRLQPMADCFQAVLPNNRNNRNFDGDIGGAALLGSCEVAAGGYIFYAAEGAFSVVCKRLTFSFRRSCRAAVEYRVHLKEELAALVAARRPFTIDLDIDVFELGAIRRQIGSAAATFHARPIGYLRSRERQARAEAL